MKAQNLGIAELIGDKREAILALAEQHGAYNVRVFGSVARGEATSESDIDFLVDFKPDYRIWDHIGLKQALEDLLGCRVDVVIAKNLHAELKPYITPDIVSL